MRAVVRVLQVVAGVATGVALTEGAFWLRDGGAFPHLNVYEADAELGVRLRPGASQRVQYAGNPRTHVRIDAAGFRGAGWGPPVEGEVLVFGDSQVFGLGVEEDETTPAQLEALLGAPVRNAGVPTWGPEEYLATMARLLPERRPAAVVLVLNFANDPFELARPNRERHAVWDGWAVRRETMPPSVRSFPGRHWLYNRSHAFYALRRWLHEPVPEPAVGLPSEGTWDEVLSVAAVSETPAPEISPEGAELAQEVASAASRRRELERELGYALLGIPEGSEWPLDRWRDEDALEAHFVRAHVGDIVESGVGQEAARSVQATAALLRRGAELRRGLERRLRAFAEAHPGDWRSPRIRALLAEQEALEGRLGALAHQVGDAHWQRRSPLTETVTRARALCDEVGAELVVVALPLDVQVSETEWEKYGAEPVDMSETRVLLDDLVADARALGVRALDPTDALAAAEPGAFLHADLHLTPKGHAALASAIADVMRAPPLRWPDPGLPVYRSRVPTADEWQISQENLVRGSSRNHCTTREVREWLRVTCTRNRPVGDEPPLEPVAVVLRDGPLEAMAHAEAGLADLVVPLLPGRDVHADFVWRSRTETLSVTWDGERPQMAFEARSPVDAAPSEHDLRLSRCLGPEPADWYERAERRFGAPERCAAFTDCDALIACAQGTRAVLPPCGPDEANAGSAGFCLALCNEARPCAEGVCTPWQGAGVCL